MAEEGKGSGPATAASGASEPAGSCGTPAPGLQIKMSRHRPANYRRSLLHIGSAAVALVMVEFVLEPRGMVWVAGFFCAAMWALEAGLRLNDRFYHSSKWIVKLFAHPGEMRKINSATWYATALLILGLTGSRMLAAVAVVILGLGDQAASLIGRRWGSIRLMNNKSLEGFLAFVVAGEAAAVLVLLVWHPAPHWQATATIGAVAALLGAVAELFSQQVDDNLAVPLAAALGAWIAASLLGVPV